VHQSQVTADKLHHLELQVPSMMPLQFGNRL